MPKKLLSLRKRHMTSFELDVDSVHQVSAEEWSVFAGTEMYTVSSVKKDCSCDNCATCEHAFSCTCTDSAVLWNMCKHIHPLCRATSPNLYCPQNDHSDVELLTSSPGCSTKTDDSILVKELSTKKKKVDDLEMRKLCEAERLMNIINGIRRIQSLGVIHSSS